MQRRGPTGSSCQAENGLWTPDTLIRAALPGMKKGTAVVDAGPAMGAAFTGYTAELEAGGYLGDALTQRFAYVLEGELNIDVGKKKHRLKKGGYCYVPQGTRHSISAAIATRAMVIEKPYQPV